MKNTKYLKYASYLLWGLVSLASIAGLLFHSIYAKETDSYAAQGRGQDLVNLLIAGPLLLIATRRIIKGSITAISFWIGSIIYILYTYILYSLAMHFNQLFLLYVAILGLSFYTFVIGLLSLDIPELKDNIQKIKPSILTKSYLLLVPVLFYFVWLSEVIPAVIDNKTPESAAELGLLVNAVHVLDIGLFLPGLLATFILLKKKNIYGYILAPTFMVFTCIMSIAILAMIIFMYSSNISVELPMIVIFITMLLFSIFTLRRQLSNTSKI